MPIDKIDKKRPICDTDIWIKSCKYKEIYKKELIFDIYENVFMPDAVRQELGRKRDEEDEFKEDFKLGLQHFAIENTNRLRIIRSYDEKFFNEEEIQALDREFLEKGIIYDRNEKRYKGTKSGLGEKVTLIMAAILEIPIILSDDNHCRKGAKVMKIEYPYLNVINFYDLLKDKHKVHREIKPIYDNINKPINKSKQGLAEVSATVVGNNTPNLKGYRDRFKKH